MGHYVSTMYAHTPEYILETINKKVQPIQALIENLQQKGYKLCPLTLTGSNQKYLKNIIFLP